MVVGALHVDGISCRAPAFPSPCPCANLAFKVIGLVLNKEGTKIPRHWKPDPNHRHRLSVLVFEFQDLQYQGASRACVNILLPK